MAPAAGDLDPALRGMTFCGGARGRPFPARLGVFKALRGIFPPPAGPGGRRARSDCGGAGPAIRSDSGSAIGGAV